MMAVLIVVRNSTLRSRMTHSPQLLFLCLCVLSVFSASDGFFWRRRRLPLPQCERAFPATAKSGIVHDCTYQCKGWPFRMGAEANGVPCWRRFGRVGHCLYGKCSRGTWPWPVVSKTTAGRTPQTTKTPTTQHGPDQGKRKQKCKRAFPLPWGRPYVRRCRYLCLGFPLRMDTEYDGTACLFQAWPRRTMGHCYNGVCKKGKQPTTTMTTGVTIGTITTKELRRTSTLPTAKSTRRMTTMAQTWRPTSFTKAVTTPYPQDSSSKFTISPGTIESTEMSVTSPAQESTTSYSALPSVSPEDTTPEPFHTTMVYSSSSTQSTFEDAFSTRGFPATTGEGFTTSPFSTPLSTQSSVEEPYSQSSAKAPSTEDGRTLLTTKLFTEGEASTTSRSSTTKAEELKTPRDEFPSSTHSSVVEPSSHSSVNTATTEFTTELTTEDESSATPDLATSTVEAMNTTQFPFPSSTGTSVEDSSSQSSREITRSEDPQTFSTVELSTEDASSTQVYQTTSAQEFSTSHVEGSSPQSSRETTRSEDPQTFFTVELSTEKDASSTQVYQTTSAQEFSTSHVPIP